MAASTAAAAPMLLPRLLQRPHLLPVRMHAGWIPAEHEKHSMHNVSKLIARAPPVANLPHYAWWLAAAFT
jgi:hypothetical protein